MKKLLFISLIMVIVGGVLLTGCGESATTTTTSTSAAAPVTTSPNVVKPLATTSTSIPTPKYGGTLKFLSAYSPSAPFGWPLDNDWVSLYQINYIYAEPLVLLNADGSLEPMLATKWEFSADHNSLTFTLRQGVKFQDGTDFKAVDVKFMFDSNIEAKNAISKNWKSVEIIDDYTVKLNLVKFNNAVWDDLRSKSCMIVSSANVKNNSLDYARSHPVGTGPFMFVSFERDVKAVFKKNPNYWQQGKPYLDGIEFVFVKDITTQQALMQSGGGHVMTALGGRDLYDMAQKGFNTFTYAAGTDVLEPDSDNPNSIFANKNVRLAMDYAIDRAQFCKAIGYGFMYPNNQLIPVPHPEFNTSIPMRAYDPEKAKQLLAEAGYPNGFKTTLLTQAMFESQTLLVQEFLKAINITAEVKIMDNAAYWESSAKGWQDALWVTGVSFGPNFASGYKSVYPPYGNLHHSVKVPAGLVETLDAALLATDPAQEKALNQKIAQIIYDDVTVVCIDSAAMGYAISTVVQDGQWLKGADWQYWNPATTWLSGK